MARKKEEIGVAPAAGVQQAPAATPVAPTPQMQAPVTRPFMDAQQPQARQGVQPDEVAAQAPQQQAVVPQAQPQMPANEPYMDYMRKPDIQPGTPVSVLPQNTVPQERIQSQRLDKMNGVPGSVVPEIPEPSQEPLQTQALEQLQPSYWSKYGNYNWNSNGGDFWKNAKESGLSLRDAMKYYDQYQKDNGGEPLDMFEKYALYKKYDPFKSVKDQDEEEERLARHQKWERIGNALSHLANLYGTMRGAVPSQPLEDAAALTERQQKAVDRVKALRKAAGQDYLDALMAKRADEFKQRQLENKQYYNSERIRLADERNELQRQRDEAKAKGDMEKLKELDSKIAKNEAQTEYIRMQTEWYPVRMQNDTTRANASMVGAKASQSRAQTAHEKNSGEYTEVKETEKDILGTKTKETKTRVKNPKKAPQNVENAKGKKKLGLY